MSHLNLQHIKLVKIVLTDSIVRGTKSPMDKKSVEQRVRGTKSLWDKKSVGQRVILTKCP